MRLLAVASLPALWGCPCPSDGDDIDGAGRPVIGDPTAGAEAFMDHGCFACHGSDGSGGVFSSDIRFVEFERLDEYLRDAATTHTGGPFTYLTDQTLADLVAFLNPPDDPPPPDDPGPALPPCISCHSLAMGQRRPIVDDTGRGVHALSGNTVTNSACMVCHETTRHQQGQVRLWASPTAPGSVVVLEGDPRREPAEADKVIQLCRRCHQARDYELHRVGEDWQPACTACHNVHNPGSANRSLIGTVLHNLTLGDDRPVVFTSQTGAGSFGDGLGANDGVCQVCHTKTSHHRQDGDGTTHNEGVQCTVCHTHSTGFLPPGGTICIGCHSSPQGSRPQIVNADGTGGHHLTGKVLVDADCLLCHEMNRHQQGTVRLWLDPNDPTTPLPVTGDPDELVPFCSNCHDAMTHPITHSTDAPWEPACTECHELHDPANANLSLVSDVVHNETLDEDKPVVFTSRTGANSFDNRDPAHNDGICQVCHTATVYHRYDGTGTPHNDGADCTICHPHANGFIPPGGLSCVGCHSRRQSGRSQVVNADGSGGHHLAGSVLTDDDCLRCHERSRHQLGTVRLWLDPNNPTTVLSVSRDPDALVPFCSNCHNAMTHPITHTTGAPWEPACTECHELHDPANANLSLVNDVIHNQTLGTNRPVVFTSPTGANSFDDGDPAQNDGICQVCHTATAYHLHDGTGTPHNGGADCTTCHPHGAGFMPQGRHHLKYGTVIPSPTNAPFGTSGESYVCLSCHALDISSGTRRFLIERNCLVCHRPE